MPPVRMRGDGRKAKDPKKVLLRLLSYMKQYIPILIVVLLCILGSAIAQTPSSKSLGTLVDNYILPMVETGSTDFSPLLSFLVKIGCIFALGIGRNQLVHFSLEGRFIHRRHLLQIRLLFPMDQSHSLSI